MTPDSAVRPTCTVVVCTRNRSDLLDRCLAGLARLTYPHYDVIVVDNAPADDRTLEVAGRWGARYLVEPIPGLSRARNTGARACSSDVIAFVDDDAVVDSRWLSELVAEFTDPGVAAVTGRTFPLVEGTFDQRVAARSTDLGPRVIRLHRGNPRWFEIAHFGGIGNGNNMSFRRQVFEAWSGFDERLGRGALLPGGEEHRAFGQLVERGFTVVYTPRAVVGHPAPQTRDERLEHHIQSRSELAAYALFLFLETPQRLKVVRYVVEAAAGVKRTWRFRTEPIPPDLVSRWGVLRACVTGAATFLWGWLRTPAGPGRAAQALVAALRPRARITRSRRPAGGWARVASMSTRRSRHSAVE